MNLTTEMDTLRRARRFGPERVAGIKAVGPLDTPMSRYHALVDKEHREGLTAEEAHELTALVAELEQEEEPLRQAIEQRAAEEHQRHLEEMAELRQLSDRLDVLLARLRPERAVSSRPSLGDP